MPLLLALDTATDACAVALWEGGPDDRPGGRLVAELALRRGQEHAARLVPTLDALLGAVGCCVADLAAVAVAAGPGSYTGLRIGASTAKALCLATGAALVPVPTLDALALGAAPSVRAGEALVVVLPSRRGEVYAAAFGFDAPPDASAGAVHERPLRIVSPRVLLPAAALALADVPAWLADLGPSVRLAGPGASRLADVLPGVSVVPGVVASAAHVARLGARALAAGLATDVSAWEPAYLKEWRPGP